MIHFGFPQTLDTEGDPRPWLLDAEGYGQGFTASDGPTDADGRFVGHDGREETDGPCAAGLVDLHDVGRAIDHVEGQIGTRFEPFTADLHAPVDAQAYLGTALGETLRRVRRAATSHPKDRTGAHFP